MKNHSKTGDFIPNGVKYITDREMDAQQLLSLLATCFRDTIVLLTCFSRQAATVVSLLHKLLFISSTFIISYYTISLA